MTLPPTHEQDMINEAKKKADSLGRCPVCGGVNGVCRLTGGTLMNESKLTVNQWALIYRFMVEVQLPFIHSILAGRGK